MASRGRTSQRGAVLLVMMLVLILGTAWWLVTARSESLNRTAENRAHNAKVLSQAKAALIGYVAHQAAQSGEDDPGALPCPEANGDVGTSNEGRAGPNCAPVAIGRLPWKRLGLDKLVDAASEPLWYVVSPGWAKPNSITNTVINSNSVGQLTVDGMSAVALIIAPGQAVNTTCTPPKNQVRSAPAPGIDALDYMECITATSYSATGNDQVVIVTAADVLPAIEAAVAFRFERQIAPAIRSAYSNSDPANPNPAWPTTNAVLPFAAPFGDPQTSNFKGVTATSQGLLPLNRFRTRCACSPAPCQCTPPPCAAGNDCDAAFVFWSGAATMSGADVISPSCSTSATQITCDFYVRVPLLGLPPNAAFTLQATAQNVGMGLRQLQPEATMPGVLASPRTVSGVLNPTGSASITLNAEADTSSNGGLVGNLLCGITGLLSLTLGCAQDAITVPVHVFVDHPFNNPNDATFGWFRRNRWHEVSYYALAPSIAPSGTGSCVTGTSCLTVDFLPPSGVQRALIVIAGQGVSGQARPPAVVSDWLEGENALVDNLFTVRDPGAMVNRSFNDRIAVIDRN